MASRDKAVAMVEEITAEAEVGAVYTGTVARIVDFGAFVTSCLARMVWYTFLKSPMSVLRT